MNLTFGIKKIIFELSREIKIESICGDAGDDAKY